MEREQTPGPHAYRKAQRCIELAERLRLPVVTLIDTRGADPSAPSESEGVAWAIASTFDALLGCAVPVVSFVTGEGGSGGALALACGDRLVAFSDSIFSVIGPEGAATILWRDATRADEAARLLRVTATDLLSLGIADRLIAGSPAPDVLADAIAAELETIGGRPDMAARHSRWRTE
jgi:acetyl-CoA carboxylase alpha subunit